MLWNCASHTVDSHNSYKSTNHHHNHQWPPFVFVITKSSRYWEKKWECCKQKSWPSCDTIDEWDNLPSDVQTECKIVHKLSPEILGETRQSYAITDSNGVRVSIFNENFFHQGALIPDHENNTFQLHNSSVQKAHDVCHSKTCHHFAHGQLYKCGQVALFKEIDQQFNLVLNDQQRKLVHTYKPGNLNMPIDELSNFIGSLNQPIAQCTFCPEKYHITEIKATSGKKVKFFKKQKNI